MAIRLLRNDAMCGEIIFCTEGQPGAPIYAICERPEYHRHDQTPECVLNGYTCTTEAHRRHEATVQVYRDEMRGPMRALTARVTWDMTEAELLNGWGT